MSSFYRISFIIIIQVLIVVTRLLSQGDEPSNNLMENDRNGINSPDNIPIENIIEDIGVETYSSEEISLIEYYKLNPINLRYADAEELSVLPGISILAAEKIIKLVQINPNIRNSELADSSGISPEAEILLDICTINKEFPKKYTKKGVETRSRIKERFQNQEGIEQGNYKGNSLDIYNRLFIYNNNFELGAIVNKKSGEANLDEYKSAYIQYKDDNYKIIVGDFYSEYGFGSVLWKNFPARKGSEVISPILNKGRGISAYHSTIDYAAFRGVALETNLELSDDINLRLSGSYSDKKKSSTIDEENDEVSSIYIAGYYRTENEIEKKDNLSERAIAGNIEMNTKSGFTLGTTLLSLDYSLPINSKSSTAFSGKRGNLLSAYSMYKFENNLVGSEISLDALSDKLISLSYIYSIKNFELALSGRYIDKEFRSPYGFYFGEFSYPANEKGIYTAISFKPDPKIYITFYSDVFSSIGQTYTVPGIVRGLDLFSEIKYRVKKDITLGLRIRSREKTDLITNDNSQRLLSQAVKKSIRLELNYKLSQDLSSRLRFEYLDYSNDLNIDNGTGMLTSAELKYKISKLLRIAVKYADFMTDNFSSAIYQYEYNVAGVMRSVPLYGAGSRVIGNVEIAPFDFMKIQANITTMFKNNVETLGSGNEKINSNIDTRGILQLELKF